MPRLGGNIGQMIWVPPSERPTPDTMNVHAILEKRFGDSVSNSAASANHDSARARKIPHGAGTHGALSGHSRSECGVSTNLPSTDLEVSRIVTNHRLTKVGGWCALTIVL